MAVTTLGALDGLGLGECRRRDVSPHRCVMPVFLSTKPLGHGLTEAQVLSFLDFLSERKD